MAWKTEANLWETLKNASSSAKLCLKSRNFKLYSLDTQIYPILLSSLERIIKSHSIGSWWIQACYEWRYLYIKNYNILRILKLHLLDTQMFHQRTDCTSSSFVSFGELSSHLASTGSCSIEFESQGKFIVYKLVFQKIK